MNRCAVHPDIACKPSENQGKGSVSLTLIRAKCHSAANVYLIVLMKFDDVAPSQPLIDTRASVFSPGFSGFLYPFPDRAIDLPIFDRSFWVAG